LLALSFDALQAIGRLLATVRRPNFAGRSTKKRVHPELSRPSITPARSDGRSMRSRQRRYRPPGTERIPRSSWSCAMARGVRPTPLLAALASFRNTGASGRWCACEHVPARLASARAL
jgi:hypothetical protein